MIGTVTSNEVFGRLTTVGEVSSGNWACVCECGTKVVVRWHRLASGNNKSCGCLKRNVLGDNSRTHGMSNSRITGYSNKAYGVWQAMRDRCKNKNRKDYHRYGGRGIKVCERWDKSFKNFLTDMGVPPKGHTLDRINNDGDYTPNNCKWATRKEQVYNSSRVRLINVDGVVLSLTEWLARYGTNKSTFYRRVKQGFSVTNAIKGEAK